MIKESFKGVLMSFQGSFRGFKRVSRKFQTCLLKFQECFTSESRVFQENFQGFKKVSCCMELIAATRAEGGLIMFFKTIPILAISIL